MNPNLVPVAKRKPKAPVGQQPDWLFPDSSSKSTTTKPQNSFSRIEIDKPKAQTSKPTGQAAPPPQLLTLIGAFLADYGFTITQRTFATERQSRRKKEGWNDEEGEKTAITLKDLFERYQTGTGTKKTPLSDATKENTKLSTKKNKLEKKENKIKKKPVPVQDSSDISEDSDVEMNDAPATTKSATKKAASSSSSSSGSSSSESSDSDADDEKEVPVSVVKATSPKAKANTLKRKAASSSSSSSSDASSDSSSEDEAPKSKKVKTVAAVAKSISSKTNSSSSESEVDAKNSASKVTESSSSDSDSSSDSNNDAKKASPKAAPSSSSDDSSSDDSSSDSSTQSLAKKTPLPDSSDSSSDSDSDSSSDDDKKADTTAKSESTATLASSESDSSSSDSEAEAETKASNAKKQGRKLSPPLPPTPVPRLPKRNNVPFSRIPKDIVVDERLASNAFVPYDYAQRAHEDLIVTRGKGFTKEKNKKKRGSYRGGYIDVEGKKGIKFDD